MVRFHRPVPLTRRPRASVVVPCYNYGRFLPELISGLLDQPGIDVDVLIVDDASPDGSGEVAEALAADEPRVSVLRHATNRGHIQTYNDGLAAVTGDYVVLLSADDLLPPQALTRPWLCSSRNHGSGWSTGSPGRSAALRRRRCRSCATGASGAAGSGSACPCGRPGASSPRPRW